MKNLAKSILAFLLIFTLVAEYPISVFAQNAGQTNEAVEEALEELPEATEESVVEVGISDGNLQDTSEEVTENRALETEETEALPQEETELLETEELSTEVSQEKPVTEI